MVSGQVGLYATCVSASAPKLPLKEEFLSLGIETVLQNSTDEDDANGSSTSSRRGFALSYEEYAALHGFIVPEAGMEDVPLDVINATMQSMSASLSYDSYQGLASAPFVDNGMRGSANLKGRLMTSLSQMSVYSFEDRNDIDASPESLHRQNSSRSELEADLEDCSTLVLDMMCDNGCVQVLFATRDNPINDPCDTRACNGSRGTTLRRKVRRDVPELVCTAAAKGDKVKTPQHKQCEAAPPSTSDGVGNPLFKLCVNPATRPPAVRRVVQLHPQLTKMPAQDGKLPVHATCLRTLLTAGSVFDVETGEMKRCPAEAIDKELQTELAALCEILAIVISANPDGARIPDSAGDLPCHMLARQFWRVKSFKSVGGEESEEAMYRSLSREVNDRVVEAVEITLRPCFGIRPLCRAPGSVGALLPLHIAAIYSASYDVVEGIIGEYTDGAAIKCEGVLSSSGLYPLELLEANRPHLVSVYAGDLSFDRRWRDFDRSSDLMFAYNPNILPFRKEQDRLKRFEKNIRQEIEVEEELSPALANVWVFMCNFFNAHNEEDHYASSVNRVLRGLDSVLLRKLLLLKTEKGGFVYATAAPQTAAVMKSYVQALEDGRVNISANLRSEEAVGRPEVNTNAKIHHSTTPIGALCRSVFDIEEKHVPTSFLILPYKLKLNEDGIATPASGKDRRLAIKFALQLLRFNTAEAATHHKEKRIQEAGGKSTFYLRTSSWHMMEKRVETEMTSLMSLYRTGVGYLYLLDDFRANPVVPPSADVYPIVVDMSTATARNLLPLMQLGATIVRRRSAVKVLTKMITAAKFPYIPKHWMGTAQSLLDLVGKLEESQETEALTKDLNAFLESTVTKPPEQLTVATWKGEISCLKALLQTNDPTSTYAGLTKMESLGGGFFWTTEGVDGSKEKLRYLSTAALADRISVNSEDDDDSSVGSISSSSAEGVGMASQGSVASSDGDQKSSSSASSHRSYDWSEVGNSENSALANQEESAGGDDLEESESSDESDQSSVSLVSLDSDLKQWLSTEINGTNEVQQDEMNRGYQVSETSSVTVGVRNVLDQRAEEKSDASTAAGNCEEETSTRPTHDVGESDVLSVKQQEETHKEGALARETPSEVDLSNALKEGNIGSTNDGVVKDELEDDLFGLVVWDEVESLLIKSNTITADDLLGSPSTEMILENKAATDVASVEEGRKPVAEHNLRLLPDALRMQSTEDEDGENTNVNLTKKGVGGDGRSCSLLKLNGGGATACDKNAFSVESPFPDTKCGENVNEGQKRRAGESVALQNESKSTEVTVPQHLLRTATCRTEDIEEEQPSGEENGKWAGFDRSGARIPMIQPSSTDVSEALSARRLELQASLDAVEEEEHRLREEMSILREEARKAFIEQGLDLPGWITEASPYVPEDGTPSEQVEKIKRLQRAIIASEQEEKELIRQRDELRAFIESGLKERLQSSGRFGSSMDVQTIVSGFGPSWEAGRTDILWADEGEVGELKAALTLCAEEVDRLEKEQRVNNCVMEELMERVYHLEFRLKQKEEDLGLLRSQLQIVRAGGK